MIIVFNHFRNAVDTELILWIWFLVKDRLVLTALCLQVSSRRKELTFMSNYPGSKGLDDVFPPDDLGSRPEAMC